jgi:hypothetical protein
MPNMTDLARRGTLLVLAAWFAIASTALVVGRVLLGAPFWFGSEAVLGTHAARALLAGGNPWTTEFLGTTFTAPPPSLLPYLPFVILPDEIVAAAWVAIGIGSAIYSVRKLQLAAWWLAFPPLVAGVIAGSPAPLMVALLLRAGAADSLRGIAINAAAVVLHPFAALPTLALGRWRAALAAFDVALVSVPFLAWATFIGTAGGVAAAIHLQTNGGLSAAVSPGLFLLAGAGLIALGPQRGAWLIVPALWPNAPFAYAVLALPVLAEMPLVAAALASPAAPGLIAYGIAAQCGIEGLRLRRRQPASRRWAPDELLAHHERRAPRAAPERPVSVERG